MEFKSVIAEAIAKATEIDTKEIIDFVEVPKEKNNGDFSFPCFKLAKVMHKSPVDIANEIKEKIEFEDGLISKVDVVNGFLNFYVNQSKNVENVINKFNSSEKYGSSNIGDGKKVIIEYSSPNIAKPFHIGHLKTTIIGSSLAKVYDYLGYNVVRLNHLGDYGTQFAKLIEGYKRWADEYKFDENPIDDLADIYKRINQLCEEDEKVLEECRDTFKKLEDGDEYCVSLREKFTELSMKEFDKIYELLNIKFDSINGESFYLDKMQEVIDILENNNKLVESQGAKIVDLTDQGINTPCIIWKSNGASIYATRDLAAILYRTRTYDYDKILYVVGNEQKLYFEQLFAVAKFLGLDEKYTNDMHHVAYGLIRLPEGKMSTRKGNFIRVDDLLQDAINKANEIMADRDIDNKELIAKQVGIGAVIFEDLKESRIKEQVFDIKEALNFQGETGPYVQYMAVRTKSILDKAGYIPDAKDVDFSALTDETSIDIIKLIDDFDKVLARVVDKNEPSILTRYIVDLAQSYSSFYNVNKVITEEKNVQDARLYLTYMVNKILNTGLNLLGIEVPEKM